MFRLYGGVFRLRFELVREQMRYFVLVVVLMLGACAESPYLPQLTGVQRDEAPARSVYTGPEDFDNAVIQVVPSEALLDADGGWAVVEQQREMDPAKAHLAARQNVDIRRRKRMKDLSAHFEPDAKSGQDGTLRVLRIEANDDFPVFAEPEIVRTQVEPRPRLESTPEPKEKKTSALGRLKSLFGVKQAAEISTPNDEAEYAIVPPSLPDFRKVPAVLVAPGVVVPARKPVRALPEKVATPKPRPVTQKVRAPEMDKVASRQSYALRVRSGRHPGKTRLVIEVSEITKYKVAIDPIRNVLRMKMDDTRWQMKQQARLRGSRLLGTYIAREREDGSVLLEVRLNKKTDILGTMVLPPNKHAKYRVVIDLKE